MHVLQKAVLLYSGWTYGLYEVCAWIISESCVLGVAGIIMKTPQHPAAFHSCMSNKNVGAWAVDWPEWRLSWFLDSGWARTLYSCADPVG